MVQCFSYFKKNSIQIILFLFTFVIYLHNLSASVYGGDSGDFLSAIAVKGVSHPSGYPLYTILGIMMSYLPLHETLAWKVDTLSAFFTSLSVVLVYLIIFELLKKKVFAVLAAFSVAFVFPVWLFAEVSEVIALSNFFLLLLLYLAILFRKSNRYRFLFLFALTLGVSFTNHEITILLIPSLGILLISKWKFWLHSKIIGISLLLFFIGLLPYLYIPIAASHNPPINWDNATNIQNFSHLVFRKDYGWIATDTVQAKNNRGSIGITDYISYVLSELPFLVILFSMLGIIYLLRKKQVVISFALLLAFFLFGLFYVYYGSGIILNTFNHGVFEKFYTTSIIFLILFVPFGVQLIIDLLKNILIRFTPHFNSHILANGIMIGIASLIPILLFIRNYQQTNMSSLWIGDKFGYDTLSPLPKDSYLITTQDNELFNSRYIEYTKGIGENISIFIPTEAVDYIATNPALTKQLHNIVWENKSHQVTINYLSIYSALNTTHPVFTTENNLLLLNLKGNTTLIPYGLVLKLATSKEHDMSEYEFLSIQNKILNSYEHDGYRLPTNSELSRYLLVEEIPKVYANAYVNTGYFILINYRNFDKAKIYFDKALTLYPYELAYQGLGDYYYHKHNCQNADNMYRKAIDVNPVDKLSYSKLYNIDKTCLKDKEKTKQLEELFRRYPHLFQGVQI